jgi:error-prone DNA polymerase
MAAWRKNSLLESFHDKIVSGMLNNGYPRQFAEQCFMQIRGFGEYGFPESHAASFALLVYVSAWLKRYHPAAFCAALLNSQPMGFYAPAQIVRDARDHGVTVLPIDINFSQWDCALEDPLTTENTQTTQNITEKRKINSYSSSVNSSVVSVSSVVNPKSTWGQLGPAVRLGFRQVKGLQFTHAQKIVQAREKSGPFTSIPHFHRVTSLPVHAIRRLAEADAFCSLNLTRRKALWESLAVKDDDAPLFDSPSSFILHPSSFILRPPPHHVPRPGSHVRLRANRLVPQGPSLVSRPRPTMQTANPPGPRNLPSAPRPMGQCRRNGPGPSASWNRFRYRL